MISPGETWEWTAQREEAAWHVADGRVSLARIAKQVGVDERTIQRWKTIPEFQQRVNELVAKIREEITSTGLAVKENRIRHKSARHAMLRRLIAHRARVLKAHDHADVAATVAQMGPEAGLLELSWKGKEADRPELHVDQTTLEELDQLEHDIAEELGQLKVKHEHQHAHISFSSQAISLAKAFTPDQLREAEKRLKQLEAPPAVDVTAEPVSNDPAPVSEQETNG